MQETAIILLLLIQLEPNISLYSRYASTCQMTQKFITPYGKHRLCSPPLYIPVTQVIEPSFVAHLYFIDFQRFGARYCRRI